VHALQVKHDDALSQKHSLVSKLHVSHIKAITELKAKASSNIYRLNCDHMKTIVAMKSHMAKIQSQAKYAYHYYLYLSGCHLF
jgi:hypothetical protein